MIVAEVEYPGLLTTVQDLGRFGYGKLGIPEAGAMDGFALRAANLLVGNPPNAAGLEMTVIGPTLWFLTEQVIAICGGDLGAELNGYPCPTWEAVPVRQGDRLSFRGRRSGCRAYLAFAGGIDVPPILGSRSTYVQGRLGGLEGRPLRKGDRLVTFPFRRPLRELLGRRLPKDLRPYLGPPWEIRVVLGPQIEYFSADGIAVFLSEAYTVTRDANRLGYKLDGPVIKHGRPLDNISDPSPLGGIQVPSGGKPIVLLVERGTVGGYPKIATIVTVDVWRIAQVFPGETVTFRAVTVEEGSRLAAEAKSVLDRIG